MNEKLNITLIPLTIKVIEVNNKKMTISVFNQIPEISFQTLDVMLNKENINQYFLGWVSRDNGRERYLIFTFNNVLYKENYFIPLFESNFKWDSSDEIYKTKIEELKEYILDTKNQIYIAT